MLLWTLQPLATIALRSDIISPCEEALLRVAMALHVDKQPEVATVQSVICSSGTYWFSVTSDTLHWRKMASVCLSCWRKVTRLRPNQPDQSPCTTWACESSSLLSSLWVSTCCFMQCLFLPLCKTDFWIAHVDYYFCSRYWVWRRVLCQKLGGWPGKRWDEWIPISQSPLQRVYWKWKLLTLDPETDQCLCAAALSSCAHVKELIRTKQGQFTLEEHALHEEQWTLEHIVRSLQPCSESEQVGEPCAKPAETETWRTQVKVTSWTYCSMIHFPVKRISYINV